jgi:hypothetical protein
MFFTFGIIWLSDTSNVFHSITKSNLSFDGWGQDGQDNRLSDTSNYVRGGFGELSVRTS